MSPATFSGFLALNPKLAQQEATLPQFQPIVAEVADDAEEPISTGFLTDTDISSITEVSPDDHVDKATSPSLHGRHLRHDPFGGLASETSTKIEAPNLLQHGEPAPKHPLLHKLGEVLTTLAE